MATTRHFQRGAIAAQRGAVRKAVRALRRVAVREWTTKRDNAWLGVVAVALAMTASGLAGIWWAWVPLVACSVVWTRTTRWSWLFAVQLAVVGTEWAYVGAHALDELRDNQGLVGVAWAGFAGALAAAGMTGRRR